MLEHLKNLKEAAEDCDECQLSGITNAMVQTAGFLINIPKEIGGKQYGQLS